MSKTDLQPKIQTALFDLDGVILDTESQYTVLWNDIGSEYLGDSNFAHKIKGQTLPSIFSKYFPNFESDYEQITKMLKDFESQMVFNYIPGALKFIISLKEHNFNLAIVTSSGEKKMQSVYAVCPELKQLFHKCLTSEMFARGKPFPDCYLQGAEVFDVKPSECFVFEDSFNGLQAARAAGTKVIGLATTNSRQDITPYADIVIDDFSSFSYEKLRLPFDLF